MKFMSFVFLMALASTAFGADNSWYKYSCTFIDGNNNPHWGGSRTSEEQAYNRAWNNCNRSEAGGCQFVSCRSHASAAVENFRAVAARYSCSATDANYGHYYGSSRSSQVHACVKAMDNCYYHSDAPGTCKLK